LPEEDFRSDFVLLELRLSEDLSDIRPKADRFSVFAGVWLSAAVADASPTRQSYFTHSDITITLQQSLGVR